MRTSVTRQPTVIEAVDYIRKLLTPEGRNSSIKYWRSKYGDKFAYDVIMRLKEKKK